jgi:hypothetical protein
MQRGVEDAGKAKSGGISSGAEIVVSREDFDPTEHTNRFLVFPASSAYLCGLSGNKILAH